MTILDDQPRTALGGAEADALIEEARRRQRRRWWSIGAVVAIALAGWLGGGFLGTSKPTPAPKVRPKPVLDVRPGVTGFAWKRISTPFAPSDRFGPLAYDSATGQLILMGGSRVMQLHYPASNVSSEVILDDTWVFAKGSWHRMHPRVSPPRGSGAGVMAWNPTHRVDAMAYDPVRREIILVTPPEFASGTTRVLQTSTTWAWTGTQWSKVFSTGPAWGSIQQGEMVYDPRTLQLVFAPGDGGSTWVLGHSGWMRGAETPRPFFAMAYDPLTGRLIGSTSVMWWWDGHGWHEYRNLPQESDLPISTPISGAPMGTGFPVTDEATRQVVVIGDYPGIPIPYAHPTNLFTWLGGIWRPIQTRTGTTPNNPDGGFSLAYDGALQAIVAFGADKLVQTKSGAWVPGPSETWVLTHAG